MNNALSKVLPGNRGWLIAIDSADKIVPDKIAFGVPYAVMEFLHSNAAHDIEYAVYHQVVY